MPYGGGPDPASRVVRRSVGAEEVEKNQRTLDAFNLLRGIIENLDPERFTWADILEELSACLLRKPALDFLVKKGLVAVCDKVSYRVTDFGRMFFERFDEEEDEEKIPPEERESSS